MKKKSLTYLVAAAVLFAGGCGVSDKEVEADASTSVVVEESPALEETTEVRDFAEVPESTEEPGFAEAQDTTEAQDATEASEAIEEEEDTTIEIVMVGDMLMHERVMESGLQEDGSYDFSHLFAQVGEKIASADLAMVNQETILGGTELGLTGYPSFNSPYEVGDAEAEAGFDVILSATNHALDKGSKGVLRCVSFWEENYPEISCVGIYDNKEDWENDIFLYEKDGITIAVLNYTYGTNGINPPSDMPYLVNYLSESKVKEDLEKADALADFVIVCPHWGTEYRLETDSQQKKWTNLFLENGVDLVIGTHPHVIEPVEWVSDENGNEMLVYYSLGNFVNGTAGSGSGTANRMVGGMADVTLGRGEDGSVEIRSYDVIPLVCHIGEKENYTTYYLSDYTTELAEENLILKQDAEFTLEYCKELVEKVWQK
ncbi:MAG: CapA family protein [Agathobacter sp.]